MWKYCEIQILLSINKALLAGGHTHFVLTCGCFHATTQELSGCDKGHIAHET